MTRRTLLTTAVVAGCFVWAMVVVGLSFALVDRGAPQWWVMPVFGALVLGFAVLAVRRVPAGQTSVSPPAALPPPAVLPPPAAPLVEPLSAREMDVLRQLADGRSNREIAAALFVAPGTVKAHLNHIFRKLGAASRLEAVAHARRAGLLDGRD